ncbi:MAG TPA: serine/threonine-protein kinase [Gemmatimonadales bacterium]|nr:serine/threonine-protein kinase [Gemmatimonadales bacterium]
MRAAGAPTPIDAAGSIDAASAFARAEAALGARYRLERVVAASDARVLFAAEDRVLKRAVSLRVNFRADNPIRSWFLREAEALGRLDHPAIRHVYDAGIIGELAYRVGNWIEGEGLHDAVQRGPRPIPAVHTLARDLLSAMEHAHGRGVIVRRVVPASLLVSPASRGTITDLRYCNWTLPAIPPGDEPTQQAFMAPEVRGGADGDPASDVYTAGAILYFAITGVEPPLDASEAARPALLRPTCPAALERLVLRALERDPDDRYLTAAEMLEEFASDAGAFEPAAAAGGTPAPDGEDRARWEKRLRRALGDDYELLARLGQGGFGRVYRVRDLHLEREVALKILHPLLTRDPEVVERFRREAQLAARLSHPNIVNIYDIAGRSGLIWYTMELIEGPSLAQLVEREGPLPLDRVLRVLREALSALAHAHASGLVHRDIKPENMLLEPDGSLRITDFGLALALRAGRFGGATSQSGTPQFASPEQLLGERVDQRSDLYSLAAVAYFALLGEPPFPGATPEQVLARQTTNQIPVAGERREDVPPELWAVLGRALDADVAARYGSAEEFLHALNRAAGDGRRQGTDLARVAARWLRL